MNRLAIVLHAHLPYIRHEEPDRLEERWLFEAMTETYLPLIWQLEQLPKEKALTLSLSPPLLEMLADPMLQKRYMNYLQAAQALIRKEKRYGFIETDLLTFYEERYKRLEETFLSCNQNVVSLFAQYQDTVSLITTSATHAILPYMRTIEGIKAQIEAGLDCFTKHIGFRPKGFWTPECDTGIKCWRVTGKNEEKQPYHRVEAVNQVKNDASDFLKKVEQTAANAPFETVPFDAELFGHWWFEGPEWIGMIVEEGMRRGILTLPELFLDDDMPQINDLSFTTWGRDGYGDVWLNEKNRFMYKQLHAMELELVSRAKHKRQFSVTEKK